MIDLSLKPAHRVQTVATLAAWMAAEDWGYSPLEIAADAGRLVRAARRRASPRLSEFAEKYCLHVHNGKTGLRLKGVYGAIRLR